MHLQFPLEFYGANKPDFQKTRITKSKTLICGQNEPQDSLRSQYLLYLVC